MRLAKALVCIALILFVVAATVDSTPPPPTNVRITNIPQLNNEEQVFLCPTDSNIVIANWRDFRLGFRQVGVGRSTDGGQTWTDSLIPFSMEYFLFDSKQSDPTMAVDRFGNYIMCVLDYDASYSVSHSVISFYRSTDKGISWTGPFTNSDGTLPVFEDKQFITIDNTGGPYDGNVYCSWTRFPNPDQILVIRSTDNGQTFQPPVTVGPVQTSTGCGSSEIDAGQFSFPVVSSNGDLHVFWQGYALDSGSECSGFVKIKHVVSSDGGQTFTPEDTVLTVSGYTFANGGIDTYSQPVTAADITGGPFDGNLYICFTNQGPEDPGTTDIDLVKSTDNGVTWSSRLQVNDDPNSSLFDSFQPWIICNEDGVLIAVFYDERLDPPSYTLFDLFAAYSFDGGETFTTNQRITTASSSPSNLKHSTQPPPFVVEDNGIVKPLRISPQGGLIGEYIGVTAFHDKIVSVWTDSRDGNSEVYTANWYLPLLEPRLIDPPTDDSVLVSPMLSWATSWKNNQDQYRVEVSSSSDFSVLDTSIVTDTNFASLSILPSGLHYWRVKAFDQSTSDSSDYSETRNFYVRICGDVDNNGEGPDIADLIYLVDYSFGSPQGPPPLYPQLADVNGDGTLDITDIIYLVDYSFGDPPGPAPVCSVN
jgi:hypothetical protein